MKLTFVARAIAEENHDDSIARFQLSGQCSTDCYGETGAYYTVCPQHTDAEIGDMHGAALTFAVAGLPPVNLRHHAPDVCPFRYAVAVPPVIAHDAVVKPQVLANTHRHCFLTDVRMDEPGNSTRRVFLGNSFLEAADGQHFCVHANEIVPGCWCHSLLRFCVYCVMEPK